jgi:hypothetical protein
MGGLSTMLFDYEFHTGNPIKENGKWSSEVTGCLSLLLTATFRHLSSSEFFVQYSLPATQLLEVIRRLPSHIQEEVLAGRKIPDLFIPLSSAISAPSVAQVKLVNQLRTDLRNKQMKEGTATAIYEVVTNYEGIKQGLFPVDIAIKKNGQVIGFIEIDDEDQYRTEKATGEKKLRRKEQLQEFFYQHDYPEVPFLRVDQRFTEKDIDVSAVSSYCLSEFSNC